MKMTMTEMSCFMETLIDENVFGRKNYQKFSSSRTSNKLRAKLEPSQNLS